MRWFLCGLVCAFGCDDGGGARGVAPTDVGVRDAAAEDAAPVDAWPVDAAPVDAAPDAWPQDALLPDAATDAQLDDATLPDAVAHDASPPDGALVDAWPVDAWPVDAAPVDAAPVDAAPVDAAPPDGPCPLGMVLVPAGQFLFGPFDVPTEQAAYCIDRREVSAAEFVGCAEDGAACDPYDEWVLCVEMDPRRPHQCRDDRWDHPANWIDWYRAEQYCRWAGKRLPTEEEWEKAARGSDGLEWPWGDRIDCTRGHWGRGPVFDDCLGFGGLPDAPVDVESYAEVPSPYGAINLSGNVKEWIDHRVDRDALPAEDEPARSKGGGWRENDESVRGLGFDGRVGPAVTSAQHGFRCVADPL